MFEDKFVTVDGLKLRYIDEGEGPVVLLMHGGSLGSTANVFDRNIPAFVEGGYRVIAWDQPGFGLSDVPEDHTYAYRRKNMVMFIEALGLNKPHVVAHSQAGGPAVYIALDCPDLFGSVIVLGTGSLIPSMPGVEKMYELPRVPSIEDTRFLMEYNIHRKELITDDELANRHEISLAGFDAWLARYNATLDEKPKKLWERLPELKPPLLMLFGANDRGKAAERVELLRQMQPALEIHLLNNCKHLIQWDAQEEFEQLTIEFLNKLPT